MEDKWDRRLLFEVTGIRLDEDGFLESDTSDEETWILPREALTQVLVVWLARHVSLSGHLLKVDLELIHALGGHLDPIVPDHLANWSD